MSYGKKCLFRFTRNFSILSKTRSQRNASLLKLTLISSLLYFCYMMGLFTHFLERDIVELETQLKLNYRYSIDEDAPNSKKTSENNEDINKLNFRYIHNPVDYCKPFKPNDKKPIQPFIAILVKSKFGNFKHRDAIRKTWASLVDEKKLIRTLFLIGYPNEDDFKNEPQNLTQSKVSPIDKIELEFKEHGDLIQQDFVDTYYNNTLKTCMGIRWLSQYCANSKFYLFIDDDFFLNPALLMSFLKNNVSREMEETLYAGYVFDNSSPMRHFMSKWYISLRDYPFNKFPPYVAAGWYVLSRKSLSLFHSGTKIVKIFKFDDIYMGIIAQKFDIKPVHLKSVYFYSPDFDVKFFVKSVMAAHGFAADYLIQVWKEIENMVKYIS